MTKFHKCNFVIVPGEMVKCVKECQSAVLKTEIGKYYKISYSSDEQVRIVDESGFGIIMNFENFYESFFIKFINTAPLVHKYHNEFFTNQVVGFHLFNF